MSTYQLLWNYSGQPVGRYNATVGVLDNSGLYYFQEFFATDGFLAQTGAYVYIGGLAVYVNVKTVDSTSAALNGARIDLFSANVTVESKASGATGLANFTMAMGTYTFAVTWEGVRVACLVQVVSGNVSEASPLTITCQVYDPVFQALDADGHALADASLLFVTPSGREIGPYKTDVNGMVDLSQVPVGTYALTASWRGVDVYEGSHLVSSNAVITFRTNVFELTVTAKAGDGNTLSGVFVSVVDSTGLVFDAGVTSAGGSVVLRLPAGNDTLDYRYVTTYQGSSYDSGVRTMPVDLASSTSTTVILGDFPIPMTSTLDFLFALAYAITVAVLLIALLLVWRKKAARKESTPDADAEKKA